MKLPEKLSIHLRAHGHGDKGMAFYEYVDAEGVGFVMDARRPNGRTVFAETWRFRWLPDETFKSMKDLVDRLASVPEEAVAAERARWPVLQALTQRGTDAPTGSCWLHPDRPASHTASVQTCWIEGSGVLAILCAECAAAARDDPAVVIDASAQRIADCAARKTVATKETQG